MDNKLMNLIVMFSGIVIFALSAAYAMPTQMQIAEVRSLVQELMHDDELRVGRACRVKILNAVKFNYLVQQSKIAPHIK